MKDFIAGNTTWIAALLLGFCVGIIAVGYWIAGLLKKPRKPFVKCQKHLLCGLEEGHDGECNRSDWPDQL